MSDMKQLIDHYAKSTSNYTDQLITQMLEQDACLSDQRIYDALLVELVNGFVEAERQLQDLNELKNRFLGMAAHDLRNPLAAIRGYCDLILSGVLGKEMEEEFLQATRKVSDQMLNLVNDLLDVSVIESGKFELHLQIIDLAELLASRLSLVKALAAGKQIDLVMDIVSTPLVRGDVDRLSQVIDNLLTNAVKFSHSQSQVKVRLWQSTGMACLDVIDQGPGLTLEDIKRLFGAFQKLSAQPTQGEKSTGLGLSIAKKIMDAHAGTISAFNNPEVGSTFRICLAIAESEGGKSG